MTTTDENTEKTRRNLRIYLSPADWERVEAMKREYNQDAIARTLELLIKAGLNARAVAS